MKVKYQLESFGIDTTQKQLIDNYGRHLSVRTLETILSLISTRYYNSEYQQVEINHKSFSNIINKYRPYLDYLVEKGIIKIDNEYKVGEFCRSYMFNDYFKEYAIIKSIKLGDIEQNQESDGSIEIDEMVLERLREDMKMVTIKDDKVEKELLFYSGNQPIYDFKKYLSNEYNLSLLRQGRRSLWVKSERIYSHFAQLSKSVRTNHFLFNGNRITSLDIKRSFPLWFSIWLMEKDVFLDYDTKEFITSVKTEKFYNVLKMYFNRDRNLFNNSENDRPYIDRDGTKDLFANWLNGDPTLKNLHNFVIRARYPLIFDFVEKYKDGEKEMMYHALAGMESNFILNKVCKRLYDEIPGIRLLTCHDEIYFEERFQPLVKPIWDEEIGKIEGRLPLFMEVDIDIDTDIDNQELEPYDIFIDFGDGNKNRVKKSNDDFNDDSEFDIDSLLGD